MRKIYPKFIENAHRDNFTNFANIGKDRWDILRLMATESYQMF